MASTTEARPKSAPRGPFKSCGSCSYQYNSSDGCYHRQSFGCLPNCTCSLIICGLGSLLIQCLWPQSVTSAKAVLLPCSSSGSDDEACARSLIEVVRGLKSSATFWRRVGFGLGFVSGLLAVGLVVAIVYR